MSIDPEAVSMAKRFEPILLFHPDEHFFPVDPKLYLERCALWRSKPHVRGLFPGGAAAEKQEWGEPPPTAMPRMPELAKSEIAALKAETSGGKTWIGDSSLGAVIPEPPTERPPGEDWFLQLTGWEPFLTAPGEVTATSENRHPTLAPNLYDGALQGGRHWYYAEYFNNQQLLTVFGKKTPHGVDLFRLVINTGPLGGPTLVVYHFFYALHEEPLRGCEKAGDGQTFATFAGEWASVAILVDSGGNPRYIGLTSRNVGDPTSIRADGSIFPEENRIGMTVHRWEDVNRVGEHPKIFVSRGTHGNYLTPGPQPHPLQPFTPGDLDLNQGTCAQIETLDEVIAGGEEVNIPGKDADIGLLIVVGILTFGVSLWTTHTGYSSFGEQFPALEPNRMPQDETGGPLFGLILRPGGLFVPESTSAQTTEDWQTKLPAPTDKPRFDFIVDRETQLWWPPRGTSTGYAGRWGPRVTNDPKQRRSGMRCPPFALLFLEGVARLVKR
jgi:hypothetical protein